MHLRGWVPPSTFAPVDGSLLLRAEPHAACLDRHEIVRFPEDEVDPVGGGRADALADQAHHRLIAVARLRLLCRGAQAVARSQNVEHDRAQEDEDAVEPEGAAGAYLRRQRAHLEVSYRR